MFSHRQYQSYLEIFFCFRTACLKGPITLSFKINNRYHTSITLFYTANYAIYKAHLLFSDSKCRFRGSQGSSWGGILRDRRQKVFSVALSVYLLSFCWEHMTLTGTVNCWWMSVNGCFIKWTFPGCSPHLAQCQLGLDLAPRNTPNDKRLQRKDGWMDLMGQYILLIIHNTITWRGTNSFALVYHSDCICVWFPNPHFHCALYAATGWTFHWIMKARFWGTIESTTGIVGPNVDRITGTLPCKKKAKKECEGEGSREAEVVLPQVSLTCCITQVFLIKAWVVKALDPAVSLCPELGGTEVPLI